MMKKYFQLILLFIYLVPCFGYTKTPPIAPDPIMIIRFNQPDVKYEHLLERVVKKTIAIKPDVFIDVVVTQPATDNVNDDYMQPFLDKLKELGITEAKTKIHLQANEDASYPEIQLFVR